MSKIEITPELLADIEAKAKKAIYLYPNRAVLAMIERIRQLEAAQCWVIAAIDTDKAAFGPFFEKNDAEYRMDSMPTEFAKKHKIRLCKGGE